MYPIEDGGIIHAVVLGGHVLAGLVALCAGCVALVTRKGGPRHVVAGRVYVATMGIVVVTAVPLAVAIRSWFLLAIAVFTAYLVFVGIRSVRRRGGGRIDRVGHVSMVLVGIAMVLGGIASSLIDGMELGPVLVVFGAIGIVLATQGLRNDPTSNAVRSHIGYMGGAYIATVTAAITVNLTMIPPLVRWLAPTAVGVPLIVRGMRRYGRSPGSAKRTTPSAE